MDRYYSRWLSWKSVEEQNAEHIARGANPDEIYADDKPRRKRNVVDTTDPLPDRTKAVVKSREGDVLHVTDPEVVGFTEQDARFVLAGLAERQSTLRVYSTGREYRWHPDAAHALDLAHEIAQGLADRKGATMRRGKPAVVTPELLARIKPLWHQDGYPRAKIIEEFGLSYGAIRNHLGPRRTSLFGKGQHQLRVRRIKTDDKP